MNHSNLFLINLDQEIEGFRDFIGAWLYRDDAVTFLVDPGPASSIDRLKRALDKMGVDKIDYILLTHIHIDHAGGAGKLLRYFPDTKIVCHPRGIKHMIDPVKLWEGSLKVLGDVARTYGEIVPVPRDSICFQETIETGLDVIEAIETPGHAVHHLSYLFKGYLFAGEVAGVQQLLPDKIYTRPATPPRFDLESWLASLKKVMVRKPGIVCYGHYGLNNDALTALNTAGKQLLLWTEVIKGQAGEVEERLIESLMERDETFSNYRYLEGDIKKREDYFIRNSIAGIREYLG
jgi:glyoxylase-like metal-dependent hydrolase (beta-lactamase superfamily II)